MRSPHILCAVLGLILVWLAPAAQADIAVIVHAANPVQQLTSRQVAELYLGRSRTFASGQFAQVVDQGIDDPIRSRFFKDISGMSIGQVTAFWSRLKFTGQVQPPQNLVGDGAVLEFVRRNPAAIGYVTASALADDSVKAVLVLRK
jgi:ABC-type phosphate transport system substrate-binding protein